MRLGFALIAVLVLIAIPYFGAGMGLGMLFGVIIPYLALAIFILGFVVKVMGWASLPVPFRITTTTGQAKSLPWVKRDPLESPYNGWETFWRMFTEIVFFRSLFRNTKAELKEGRVVQGSTKFLWAAGLVFHYSFLVIILRHVNYFVTPTPEFVTWLQFVDGFFQIGLPILYLTDIFFVLGVGYLFLRRVGISQMRYLSLASDYFPLFLLLAIGLTGMGMRYLWKVDIVGVKELAVGLFSFNPVVPAGVGPLFFTHLFLVSFLIAYFPFSKLMHMGGAFLTPTRNMPNNTRAERHVNPWDYDVKVHTYEEYEDEFRPVMKAAGLPLDRDPDGAAKPEDANG
ncbi:sulfate reduction electron transfer complex DsrMKJOP subunit DsrM [bacterium]|nr:sulfate reduction electron transfer complex DsrMKJOP subunit DsrM [bacterium]